MTQIEYRRYTQKIRVNQRKRSVKISKKELKSFHVE